MVTSSSTLEGLRATPSPRPASKRLSSSPLSHSHTAGSFISPSTDSLLPDSSQPKSSAKSRRKGMSWNLPWRGQRNSTVSTTGLILPATEIEKAEGNQAKTMRTPWHHGWRTALFGTCSYYPPRISLWEAKMVADFNIFLLLIPASIALHFSVKEADSIIFLCGFPCCISCRVTHDEPQSASCPSFL